MPQGFDWNLAGSRGRRNLPHLRQADVVYFITFRLADSIPQEKLRLWQSEYERLVEQQGDSEETRHHSARQMERYLDGGHGRCILQAPQIGRIVADTLLHFDGERYLLDAFVAMPNHVHALVWPALEHGLDRILHSWKSYTAHEINKVMGQSGMAVWQREGFDHIVRDTEALKRFRRYVRGNPAKLQPGSYVLGEGRFATTMGL